MKTATLFKSNQTIFLLIIVVPFIALIGLMMMSGNAQVAASVSTSHLQQVDVMPIRLTQQYSENSMAVGQVEALQQSVIGFDRGGEVVQILVDEGQSVVAVQLLAVQDQQRIIASIDEINATLTRVQADSRLASLSEKRVTELVNKNLESSQRLDEVRESTTAAMALVAEIKARKASLELELDKSKLIAPYAGMVVSRAIDQGAVVAAGQGVFVVQQQGLLQARFALPASAAQLFSVGESSQLLFGQQTVFATVFSVGQQRKLATRTVDVIFSLDSNTNGLLTGDLLNLVRQQQIDIQGVWVPRSALISGVRGLWSLFVVESNEQGQQQLVSKLVEIHYVDDDKVYVSGALADQANIVVHGIHKLVPGQLVQAKLLANKTIHKSNESVL